MMAREKWSSQPLPEAARPLMDLWREQIGDKIDADLAALEAAIGDQETFARTVNKLLYDLDLLDEEPGEGESESTDQGEDSEDSDSEDEDAEAAEMDGASAEMEGSPSSEMEDGEGEDSEDSMAEQVQEEMMPGTGDEEGERAQRRRAEGFLPDEARQPAYRPYTVDFDEVDRRRGALRRRRTRPAASASRSTARPSPGDDRQARQPAAAAPAGPAIAVLGIRPRGRAARCRAALPRGGQPDAPVELQDREADRVPRHRRFAVDRQFGLDARPSDHGRGDERRHPRAHPRALRRQGRDPGVHHPRLEGWPGTREMAVRRQDPEPGPPQRPPPHRLQGRRRAVAPGAQVARADAARGSAQGKHRRRGADLGASPAHLPARAAPDSHGDLRRRAGRRLQRSRSILETISSAICATSSRGSRASRPSS